MLSLGNIPVFALAILDVLIRTGVNISFSFQLKNIKYVKGF